MRVLTALAAATVLTAVAAADDLATYRLTIDAGSATAEEGCTFTAAGSGHRLTGQVRLQQQDQVIELTYEQTFAESWQPQTYHLRLQRGSEQRAIDLQQTPEGVALRHGSGGSGREAMIPLDDRLALLDNAVAAHVQALLYRARAAGWPQEWTLVVPQQLRAVPGRLTEEGREHGRLDGQPIEVRRYGLEAAGVRLDIWAEEGTDRLMRVSVPLQGAETVRQGYEAAADLEEAEVSPCTERPVSIVSQGATLPGTLCLPSSTAAPVPGVVLVHGSGPADRDLTIGSNRPLRDLAHGLARAGIASLRYDKRTWALADQVDYRVLTIDEEVVDDAVAAVHLLRAQPEVQGSGLFVVGHSLGAMLAPTIAQRAPEVRGVVMLAPGARPFDELALAQIRYQSSLNGADPRQTEATVQQLAAYFGRVRSGQAGDDELALGIPSPYWRELLAIDVPAALADCPASALVLHGGKDVQVFREDHDLLVQALARRGRSADQAEWLPEHNHLFMRFDGPPSTAAYTRPGVVDPEVIALVANWIAATRPTAVGTTEAVSLPGALALAAAYPNPFNGTAIVPYLLDRPQRVRLAVYSATGQRVCTLVEGELPAGLHQARWAGTDDYGRPVATGAYTCRLTGAASVATSRLLLLR